MQRDQRWMGNQNLAPLAALAAITLALLAQLYYTMRLNVGDAGYAFLIAIALFVAAFPRAGRDPWPRGWLIIAQLLALAAAGFVFLRVYQNLVSGRTFLLTVVLSFLPLALLGGAFAGGRRTSRPDDGPDTVPLPPRLSPWPSWRLWAPFMALGCVLVLVGGIYFLRQGLSNDGIVITIAGVAAMLIGTYRLEGGRGRLQINRHEVGAPSARLEMALLVAILVIGAFFRFYQLELIPYGVWYDEGQAGQEALRFLQGIPFTPMGTYTSNNPSLFFYAVALGFKLLGPSLWTLRAVAGVIGVLAIPSFYVFLRLIVGWRGALIGAFLLAVSSWAVDFTRLAMCCNMQAVPFEGLTLYFLLRGLRYGTAPDFAWGGVALGLGQYTYAGFRLFPILIGLYLIYGFILNKERVRENVPGIFLFGLLAMATFVPLGTWIVQHREEFFFRTNQTSVFAGKNTPQERLAALENSLRRHLLMFNVQGDSNGRHGLPGAPAVDWISGALLVVGVAYSIYRWRSPAYFLLAVFLVITMQAGILSLDWEAPQQARTVVAIPAVYAIVAMVMAKAWSAWDRQAMTLGQTRRGRVARGAAAVTVAGVLALMGILNFNRYFVEQMHHRDAWYAFSTVETAQARRILELGRDRFRFYTQSQQTPAFQFLVGGETPDRPVDTRFFTALEHMPLHEKAERDVVYLIDAQFNAIDPAEVLRYYPGAIYHEIRDPFGKVMTYEFQVSAREITDLQALTVHFYPGSSLDGQPVVSQRIPSLAVDWREHAPLPLPFSTVWEGQLYAPQRGSYTFQLEDADGSVQVTIGTTTILDSGIGRVVESLALPRGQHPITIRTVGTSHLSLVWTRPDGATEVVPPTSLVAVTPSGYGLAGRYYRGPEWSGLPEFVLIDPYPNWRWHPDPFNSPWSAEWQGTLEVSLPGMYNFSVICNDRSWIIIDGKTLVNGTKGVTGFQTTLTAGRHDLVIRYSNVVGYAELRLLWQPPNGEMKPIPPEALRIREGP